MNIFKRIWSMRPWRSYSHLGGGLHFDDTDMILHAEPLSSSYPDKSWLRESRPGANQGPNGACVVYAYAACAEIMYGRAISDAECNAVYARILAAYNKPQGDGMTFAQGWPFVKHWFPGAAGIRAVTNLAEAIQRGPVLGGYEVTQAFDNADRGSGCLDHKAGGKSRGGHAVCIAAVGWLNRLLHLGRLIWIINSWGPGWAWRGIGVLTESLHRSLCRHMYEVVR